MTKEFLQAVKKGDLNTVKHLLNNPEININYTESEYTADTKCIDALTLAIMYSHVDVALFLIEKGIKLEHAKERPTIVRGVGKRAQKTRYSSALSLACDFSLRADILKALLKKTKNLNPVITRANFGASESDKHYRLFDVIGQRECSSGSYPYLSLLLHEGVLRGDSSSVCEMIPKISGPNKVVMTSKTVAEYLEGRVLSAKEVSAAKLEIDILVVAGIVKEVDQIKQIIEGSRVLILESIIPASLSEVLNKEPDAPLVDLFAELQYWLYPEENLPVKSIQNKTFHDFKPTYDKKLAELEEWQNPAMLKTFIALDPQQILKRLLAVSLEIEMNPAARLLVIILHHYKDAKVVVDQQKTPVPLLTQREERKLFQSLKTFYTVTSLEEALIVELTIQKQSNNVLTERVANVERELADLKRDLQQLKEGMKLAPVMDKKADTTPSYGFFK